MAEAKKYDKVTERVVHDTEPRVSLDLSLEEAQTLNALLRRVSGDPKGPRGVLTDGICAPLTAAVGTWTWEGEGFGSNRVGVSIPDGTRPVEHKRYR